jgi:hypothetical protein
MIRIPDEEIAALWERRLDGESVTELARERGSSQGALSFLFRSRGFVAPTEVRTCALTDCDVSFDTPFDSRRVFCCRKHAKLGSARRVNGTTVRRMECALPECSVMVDAHVPVVGKPSLGHAQGRRFCCKDHGDLHGRRIANGWYARLLGGDGRKCEVCGEKVMLEEHHEVWDSKTGSDISGPTHTLCVNHHQMIHRGLAEYRDGKYVKLVTELRRAVRRKAKLYENYLER